MRHTNHKRVYEKETGNGRAQGLGGKTLGQGNRSVDEGNCNAEIKP